MNLKKRKQILLVVRWPISGIRNYLRYVYSAKEFEQCHFTVVAPDLDFSRYFEQELDSSGFTYVACGNSTRYLMMTVAKLIMNQHFDLVNAHGFSSAIASLPMAKLKRIPTLLTVHDVFTAAQFDIPNAKIKSWLLTRLFSSADEIMTVSEDAKANLIEYLPAVKQTGLFGNLNGINSHYFATAKTTDFNSLLPETRGQFKIGFLGRFMSQKGFHYIIEAIEQIKQQQPKAQLVVICFGSGGFVREDYTLIEQQGLTEYFKFLPYTDDVAAAIKGLDLVVMPSLWEACGLLAMEALCAGTPLIATDCIGLREVLKGTPAIQVKPKDGKALAKAIMAQITLNDKSEFTQYSPTACHRFDVSKHASVLFSSYERLFQG